MLTERFLSNHAPRQRTVEIGLISESPTVTDSSWTLFNCWQEPTTRSSVLSIVYLESVGDHPRSNVSCTSLAKFSERIMLRRCRQRLGGQIQRISYAYAWILGRWFLTPLKIEDTYIINKICPRQLPCGTQQSMARIFWGDLVDENTLSV